MPAIITTPAARGLTTLGRPKAPRHSFTRLYDDGSAVCLSGRSQAEYAVCLDDCDCDRCRRFHKPSCSHRDQLGEVQEALDILRAECDGFEPLAPAFHSETPCYYCDSERTVHVLYTSLNSTGRRARASRDVCLDCRKTRYTL